MVERGVILAPSGTRVEVSHLFPSYADDRAREFGLDVHGSLDTHHGETGKELCEAVFNGVMTLDQVEAMLLETAVDKAHGNLSAAARMLGLTRPQLAYRLKRLHEGDEARGEAARWAAAGRRAVGRRAIGPPRSVGSHHPMTSASRQRALRYLREHHVMTLATQGGDGPWAAAVFYVNVDFTLYFLSAPSSRHCTHIAAQARVAATIHEDYADWPQIRGIQLEGIVRELSGADAELARRLYGEKFPIVGDAAQTPRRSPARSPESTGTAWNPSGCTSSTTRPVSATATRSFPSRPADGALQLEHPGVLALAERDGAACDRRAAVADA